MHLFCLYNYIIYWSALFFCVDSDYWLRSCSFSLVRKQNSRKFEDLISFSRQFMNRGASHLATRRWLSGVVWNGSFCRQEDGARELLAKEKKGLFLEEALFFLRVWGREWQRFWFYHARCFFFLWGLEEACVIDYLTVRLENSRLVD